MNPSKNDEIWPTISQSVSELARSNLECISIKRKMDEFTNGTNLETPMCECQVQISLRLKILALMCTWVKVY